MRIQYFADTDTLYILLNGNAVDETRDLDENTVLDLDREGNLVALTIEHAQTRVNVASFSFERISSDLAQTPATEQKQFA